MPDWKVFVLLGDSITAGFQQGPGNMPPRYYPFTNLLESSIRVKLREMGASVDVAIENKGLDGDSTGGMVNRFTGSVVPENPDYVLIMGGLNDLFTRISPEVVFGNLLQLVEMTRELGAEPIILSVTPVAGAIDFNQKIKELNEKIQSYCGSHGIRFIDLYNELTLEGILKAEYSNDGVHISDKGYGKIISILHPLLLELVMR